MSSRKKLKKWKILTNIKIEKIWFGGVGISTFFDWKKIIVKGGVLPDSIVKCRVIKEKKDYIDCQMVQYEQLPDFIDQEFIFKNVCEHHQVFEYFWKHTCNVGCWWCKWQILPYEEQLKLKQKVFIDSFRHLDDEIKNLIENILSQEKNHVQNFR